MADNETIADVIAWLRKPREGENAYLTLWRDEIADRLDAAHKRERGDSAKLREAVKETQSVIARCMDILNRIPDSCGYGGLIDDVADELCDLREQYVKPALAATEKEGANYGNE